MPRPALGPSLQQTLGQHQLLLPRMLQSVEVLQLPALELDAWLRAQVESNEALQLVEPAGLAPPPVARTGAARARERTEAHDEMLRNLPERDGGLGRQVAEELAGIEDDDEVLAWVRFLVECLDERGFLQPDDETLLRLGREQGLRADAQLLGRAVERLQALEPRGLGARGPVEALLLQLDPADPDHALLRSLLGDFLEELARNKRPAVARALSIPLPDLERLLDKLAALDPAPGAALHESVAPPLRPELVVEPAGEGFELSLDRSRVASVRIDPGVARLARDRAQPTEVRRYLRGKLDRARWLIDAVEQRERTLLRIAGAAFERQRAFLEHGPGHLVPLRMSDLADDLGLHVSTVSRAVAGKHAQTPWGIVPLRGLFQGSAGDDEDTARDDLLRAVRELVEAEDPHAPLSDEDIAAALARRGWRVARRTVAKYRGELSIPSSYRRRRY
jgi:RNA polymerase sigma-54 factor